jgi:hypothetical protein
LARASSIDWPWLAMSSSGRNATNPSSSRSMTAVRCRASRISSVYARQPHGSEIRPARQHTVLVARAPSKTGEPAQNWGLPTLSQGAVFAPPWTEPAVHNFAPHPLSPPRFHPHRCPISGQWNTCACRVDTRVLDAPSCRTDSNENTLLPPSRIFNGIRHVFESVDAVSPRDAMVSAKRRCSTSRSYNARRSPNNPRMVC